MSEYTEGPWIEHTTGKMPVPGDTMVRVRTGDGIETHEPREAQRTIGWDLNPSSWARIIQYRVQADENGWIRHVPGDCPVGPETLVSVKTRSGWFGHAAHSSAMPFRADTYDWAECGDGTITCYKVLDASSATQENNPSTLESLISAAIAYKDATTHQQEALERLNEAVKAFKEG